MKMNENEWTNYHKTNEESVNKLYGATPENWFWSARKTDIDEIDEIDERIGPLLKNYNGGVFFFGIS